MKTPHRERSPGTQPTLSSDEIRKHLVATSGEFVGTYLFLFFSLGATQVANNVVPPNSPERISALLYICLAFGFSLGVTAWAFFRISGGLFNPAVTLGMCIAGQLPWTRGAILFLAQMVAGMAAAGVVKCIFPGPFNVLTTLSNGTSIAQGVFIEMFLTAELVITVLMLAAEKTKATFVAPVGIGLSLFVAMLTGIYFTGGSLNPTRSFGPCVAAHSFPGYHWIYWVGPFLGALLAAGYYRLMKLYDYESANPGQDSAHQSYQHQEESGICRVPS